MGRVWGHRTWSIARSNALNDCPRGFFFRYAADREPDQEDAKLLKRLSTTRMEAGSIVHDLILQATRAFRDDGEILYGLADEGERLYRERSLRSIDVCAHMRQKRRPPVAVDKERFVAFVHDFHGHDLGVDHEDAMVARIRRCLEHFEVSDLWAYLRGLGCAGWAPLTEGGAGSLPRFTSGKGIEIYASWDFLATDAQGTTHIVDWKTGSGGEAGQRKARLQLCVYASWAAFTMAKPLRRVRVHPAFLADDPPPWQPLEIAPDERQLLAERVNSDVTKEAKMIEHRKNKSGRIYEHWAYREAFPPRPNTRMCLDCGWRDLCPEGQAECSHVPSRFAGLNTVT